MNNPSGHVTAASSLIGWSCRLIDCNQPQNWHDDTSFVITWSHLIQLIERSLSDNIVHNLFPYWLLYNSPDRLSVLLALCTKHSNWCCFSHYYYDYCNARLLRCLRRIQGRNHVFKVGGPIPWSRVLLPFYRKKIDRSIQFGAVGYIITQFIKSYVKTWGSVQILGGPDPPDPPVVAPMDGSCDNFLLIQNFN